MSSTALLSIKLPESDRHANICRLLCRLSIVWYKFTQGYSILVLLIRKWLPLNHINRLRNNLQVEKL